MQPASSNRQIKPNILNMSKKKTFGCIFKITGHLAEGKILATIYKCPLDAM